MIFKEVESSIFKFYFGTVWIVSTETYLLGDYLISNPNVHEMLLGCVILQGGWEFKSKVFGPESVEFLEFLFSAPAHLELLNAVPKWQVWYPTLESEIWQHYKCKILNTILHIKIIVCKPGLDL